MSSVLNRREFLKVVASLPAMKLAMDISPATSGINPKQETGFPNILIIVFDALSATNVSLYGYPRETTPNLTRFADKATVFHRHYAGGSFTSPGTASLLTGTYPWTNRAFHLYGTVSQEFTSRNIFNIVPGDIYQRMTFTHNDLAAMLLHQFANDIELIKKTKDLCLFNEYLLADSVFSRDRNAAFLGERTVTRGQRGQDIQLPSSTFLSAFHRVWRENNNWDIEKQFKDQFPRGLPSTNAKPFVYLLEDAIDWVLESIQKTTQPFLGYFHFLPPHEPYHTRKEFFRMFRDGWAPIEKPVHILSGRVPEKELQSKRRWYDEYIAYVDAEFGRLINVMEAQGLLNNTYVMVTSDHGEMFERGILEHITPTLFEPIARVPMVIHKPDQLEREDVFTPTSAVDLLPTISSIVNQPAPVWSEGVVLPSFTNQVVQGDRNIFIVDSKSNPKNGPLQYGTVAMIKEHYKLINYHGYDGLDHQYEMYDLINDPEELEDLYTETNPTAEDMKAELSAKVKQVDEPFRRN